MVREFRDIPPKKKEGCAFRRKVERDRGSGEKKNSDGNRGCQFG